MNRSQHHHGNVIVKSKVKTQLKRQITQIISTILGCTLLACMPSAFAGTSTATLQTGVYAGKFGEGKATIFIDNINNGKVTGRSLYRHTVRPVSGSLKSEGKQWRLVLKEPATQRGDGQFVITVNQQTPTQLSGSWQVFSKTDSKAGIPAKNFTFSKGQCDNSNHGYYQEMSASLYDSEDLYLSPDELSYMRNELFARHGYSFKTSQFSEVFAQEDWYVPCYTSINKVSKQFNSIEQKNLKMIQKMEDYAVKNPSMFGR